MILSETYYDLNNNFIISRCKASQKRWKHVSNNISNINYYLSKVYIYTSRQTDYELMIRFDGIIHQFVNDEPIKITKEIFKMQGNIDIY